MINNLYQKTLNDIADYSYEKMKFLNTLFANWKQKWLICKKQLKRDAPSWDEVPLKNEF